MHLFHQVCALQILRGAGVFNTSYFCLLNFCLRHSFILGLLPVSFSEYVLGHLVGRMGNQLGLGYRLFYWMKPEEELTVSLRWLQQPPDLSLCLLSLSSRASLPQSPTTPREMRQQCTCYQTSSLHKSATAQQVPLRRVQIPWPSIQMVQRALKPHPHPTPRPHSSLPHTVLCSSHIITLLWGCQLHTCSAQRALTSLPHKRGLSKYFIPYWNNTSSGAGLVTPFSTAFC